MADARSGNVISTPRVQTQSEAKRNSIFFTLNPKLDPYYDNPAYKMGYYGRGTILMGRQVDTASYVLATRDPNSPLVGRVLNPEAWEYPAWTPEINRLFWLGGIYALRPFEFLSSLDTNIGYRMGMFSKKGKINKTLKFSDLHHCKNEGYYDLGGTFPEIVWPLQAGYTLVHGTTESQLSGHAYENLDRWFLLPPAVLPLEFNCDPYIGKLTHISKIKPAFELIKSQYQQAIMKQPRITSVLSSLSIASGASRKKEPSESGALSIGEGKIEAIAPPSSAIQTTKINNDREPLTSSSIITNLSLDLNNNHADDQVALGCTAMISPMTATTTLPLFCAIENKTSPIQNSQPLSSAASLSLIKRNIALLSALAAVAIPATTAAVVAAIPAASRNLNTGIGEEKWVDGDNGSRSTSTLLTASDNSKKRSSSFNFSSSSTCSEGGLFSDNVASSPRAIEREAVLDSLCAVSVSSIAENTATTSESIVSTYAESPLSPNKRVRMLNRNMAA